MSSEMRRNGQGNITFYIRQFFQTFIIAAFQKLEEMSNEFPPLSLFQRFPKISELFSYPDPQKPDRAACRSIRLEEIARKTRTHTVNV